MTMLAAALSYAKKRWPIFPCNAAKEPLCDNGVLEATTNLKKIEEWWAEFPNANIGLDCGGASFLVLDLDPGYDWAELEKNIGPVPETALIQTTPRGGEHLFFRIESDEVIPQSQSKFAKNVDVRSFHSYVLLPPSKTVDGHYTWTEEGQAARRSDGMVSFARKAREQSKDHDTWIIEPDLPENIEKAIGWLKHKAEIAIEGVNGDSMAFATGAYCKSLGISPELALDLIWEHWNPRCQPPWPSDEIGYLETKVDNAYYYNTSPPGNLTNAYKDAKRRELLKPVVQIDDPDKGTVRTAGHYRLIDRPALAELPPLQWLIEDMIPEQGYCVLFGASQSFKTFLAVDLAMRVATASSPLWLPGAKVDPGPVLYSLSEGRAGLNKRIKAWESYNPESCLLQRDSFMTIDPVPAITDQVETFIELALTAHKKYKLCVIDTVSRSLQGVNENAQENVSAFTGMVELLQRELGCAVIAIHHTNLTSPERESGSGVFGRDADTRLLVQRPSLKQNDTLIKMVKQKDAEIWADAVPIKLIPHQGSLTPIKGKFPKATPDKKNPSDEDWLKRLDRVIEREMKKHPGREFTANALATLIASAEDIDLGEQALRRNHLPLLRAKNGTFCHGCFDPIKNKWRFTAKPRLAVDNDKEKR